MNKANGGAMISITLCVNDDNIKTSPKEIVVVDAPALELQISSSTDDDVVEESCCFILGYN